MRPLTSCVHTWRGASSSSPEGAAQSNSEQSTQVSHHEHLEPLTRYRALPPPLSSIPGGRCDSNREHPDVCVGVSKQNNLKGHLQVHTIPRWESPRVLETHSGIIKQKSIFHDYLHDSLYQFGVSFSGLRLILINGMHKCMYYSSHTHFE